VALPVTSTDRAWITPHSKALLSGDFAASGVKSKLSHPNQLPRHPHRSRWHSPCGSGEYARRSDKCRRSAPYLRLAGPSLRTPSSARRRDNNAMAHFGSFLVALIFSVPPAATTARRIFFRLSPLQSLGMSLTASRTAAGSPILAKLPGCCVRPPCSSMKRHSPMRPLIQTASRRCPVPVTCLGCLSFDYDSRVMFRTQERRAKCPCRQHQR